MSSSRDAVFKSRQYWFLDGKIAWKAIVRETAADRGRVSSRETFLAHRRRGARAA